MDSDVIIFDEPKEEQDILKETIQKQSYMSDLAHEWKLNEKILDVEELVQYNVKK